MRKSSVFWIIFSGTTWFAVGIFLLMFGVKLVVFSCLDGAPHSLLSKISTFTKNKEQAALALVSIGLLVGFMKGRFVLSKTVARVVSRLQSFQEPIKISQVYSFGYLILIACMILLGMGLRWLSFPADIRGAIDIAIGSALMNGAMFYFRALFRKEKLPGTDK